MTTKERRFLSYLAGLIDGEGCLNIIKITRPNGSPSYRASIMINMVDGLSLAVFKSILGEEFKINFYLYEPNQENRQNLYCLCIYDNNCLKFLDVITPYLIIKYHQAKELKRFLVWRRKWIAKHQGGKYPSSYWDKCSEFHKRLKKLRQTPLNGVNSVELLNHHDLRQYRAKLEDVEHLRNDVKNILEGVETRLSELQHNKTISAPEKDIVRA